MQQLNSYHKKSTSSTILCVLLLSIPMPVKAGAGQESSSVNVAAVTAPPKSKVVELLVKPGSKVNVGQTVAIVASPELLSLHASLRTKQAEALAALKKRKPI